MMKMFVSVGFLVDMLLGNICLMPIAYAAGMPVPESTYMEMVMTPVIPMSPLHCNDCIAMQEKSGTFQAQGCAGHCLVQAKSTAVSLASSYTPVIAVTGLLKMIFTSEETVLEVESLAMGPPIVLHIDTTVLRL